MMVLCGFPVNTEKICAATKIRTGVTHEKSLFH